MNLVKSKYSTKDIEAFRMAEAERIGGEKNVKLVRIIENVITGTMLFLLCLSFGLAFSRLFGHREDSFVPTIATIISTLAILVGIFLVIDIFLIGRTGDFGLFRITIKILKAKNISLSPIMPTRFDHIQKEHKTLEEMVLFVESVPDVRFEPYDREHSGRIRVTYSDGPYNAYRDFMYGVDTAVAVLKKDNIDCSVFDKTLDEWMASKNEE